MAPAALWYNEAFEAALSEFAGLLLTAGQVGASNYSNAQATKRSDIAEQHRKQLSGVGNLLLASLLL